MTTDSTHALDQALRRAWGAQDRAAGSPAAASDDAFVRQVLDRLPARAPTLDAAAALALLRRRRPRRSIGLEALGAVAGTLALALSLLGPSLPADPLRLGLPLALGTLLLALALLWPGRS